MTEQVVKDFHALLSFVEEIKTDIKDGHYKKIVDLLMILEKQSENQDIAIESLRWRHNHNSNKIKHLESCLLKLSIKHLKLDRNRCKDCEDEDESD